MSVTFCNACQSNVKLPHDCPDIPNFKRGLSHKPSHKPGELQLLTLGDILKFAEKLELELCGHLPPESEQTGAQMDEYEQILKTPVRFSVDNRGEAIGYNLRRINKISKNILTGEIEIQGDDGDG
jgi:hypothetical protein